MSQYQTFPDAVGASSTIDKLRALHLPAMEGCSFLDVGCNEGFFCGFARFDGAARVVGIDRSQMFIERARQRFPDCEFLNQGWDALPEGEFDVILLASALHYADDQPALVRRLVSRLTRDGVLILELGIASAPGAQWVRVQRGIDERDFPTMGMVSEMLNGLAWKWMGPSVSQPGDPVQRHVVHISRMRPLAYLLMQPPAFGKSTISANVFVPAGIRIVSGDAEIAQAVRQRDPAVSDALHACLSEAYSPYRLDEVIRRVFEAGLGGELLQMFAARANGESFALDAYVPEHCHPLVESGLADAGYLPILMTWRRAARPLRAVEALEQQSNAFLLRMDMESGSDDRTFEPSGIIDELEVSDGRLHLRGWSFGARGRLEGPVSAKCGEHVLLPLGFQLQTRQDVQVHFGLPSALCGFQATFALSDTSDAEKLAGLVVRGFAVGPAEGIVIPLPSRSLPR
ncbi:class I SAM-dependent methyltransferase [Luteimonas sp. XNQY3]|nr:class I SAM-dependent methyltransferase [Luteimonas sp. XNQY3]MCD9005775.1 class I SAM-dependent methyltransferase [Luteimonas sp. XNQY3]